jgi:hypothetical protein
MTASPANENDKSPLFNSSWISSRQSANEFLDLLKVACAASQMDWVRLIPSIFRTCRKRSLPIRKFSEYNILNPLSPVTKARFLMDLVIPAFPESTPDLARMLLPPVVNRRFWRPTGFFRQPDEYANVCSFPKEQWFFINGIATNEDVARLNSAHLAHLFHRPVTVIQNATCSLEVDILECVIGKGLRLCDKKMMTEPAWRATTAILEALSLEYIDRVVVIAHSQGTIIMSNVLATIKEALKDELATQKNPEWHEFTNRWMGKLVTEEQKMLRNGLAHALAEFTRNRSEKVIERLAKLEIYTFANCADKMNYVTTNLKLPFAARELPYMEHFANEFDWVARLGILSPLRGDSENIVEINGEVYEQKEQWGHLLNEHYLMAIDDHLYPGSSRFRRNENPFPPIGGGEAKPRLYQYFHGNSP